MNFKRFFYLIFGAIFVVLFVIVGMVVVVDPYQQYRLSEKYIDNQRLENPGMAKHHDYNAVIVGSSMAMNHYPSQVDSLFGWNTINLTTMGGLDVDYSLLFPHIAESGKMKNMVWCLDYFCFTLPKVSLAEPYLYDDKWWNDYPYWLNYTSCKNAINKLIHNKTICRDSIYHFNSPSGKKYLLKYYKRDNNDAYWGRYDFTRMKERFDDMEQIVMPALKGVDVYVYFSPYSILEFKMYEQYGHWEQVLEFKRYMIERLLSYPNVRLYDFQNENFICNLDEYMDLRHHSHAYNKRIIECIYKDSCRVNEGDYGRNLMVLDSLVRNYQIDYAINEE